ATLLAVAVVRRSQRYDPFYGILIAASVGFAAAYVAQAKGWPYHSYPMMALALIALACALSERRAIGLLAQGGRLSVPGFLGTVTYAWMNAAPSRTSLVAPIRQIKPHPTMLAIASNIAVGHPLVRQVEGRWISAAPALWITACVLFRRKHETL